MSPKILLRVVYFLRSYWLEPKNKNEEIISMVHISMDGWNRRGTQKHTKRQNKENSLWQRNTTSTTIRRSPVHGQNLGTRHVVTPSLDFSGETDGATYFLSEPRPYIWRSAYSGCFLTPTQVNGSHRNLSWKIRKEPRQRYIRLLLRWSPSPEANRC